ncbi:MAG: hypothetical protein BGO42_15325 [Flavobacterium sp. 40-81]|nr:MAG: hypothetical protein BGO42_15325 [Flavobacterium sp. 40-81]
MLGLREGSEKPTARYGRGLVAESPTCRDTPKGFFLKLVLFVASPLIVLLTSIGFLYIIL